MRTVQAELFEDITPHRDALDYFADASAEQRGAIHTKPEVASFVLDLVGWVSGPQLLTQRLLEPSAGDGDFLIPAVERLLQSAAADDTRIANCVRAVEVNTAALRECRRRLHALFVEHHWSEDAITETLDIWLTHADFLTLPLQSDFTHVVGNPPYLRLENLPKELLRLYRSQWRSLFDRADLYVAFIEKSLGLLEDEGCLGFICADRWMKNRYGGPLRNIIAESFHVEAYIDFTGCPAFLDDVDAYPAVTSIRRGHGRTTRTAFRPPIEKAVLQQLAKALRGQAKSERVASCEDVAKHDQPWSFDEDGYLSLLRRLEHNFPALQEVDVKVGIGVATGADAVFINNHLDVEISRKLPLVTTRDIRSGEVEWMGKWVLNPFEPGGGLVDLKKYPKLAAYVELHRERIASRNVAQRAGDGWYRTIDRIHEPLTHQPKLLIPDIKGTAHVVYEPGKLYPHHNLYYVVSDAWDLRALQTVLSSRVAQAFVAAYSPRMRGGNFRFQAQYLRRIRIPRWDDVSAKLRRNLHDAATRSDPRLASVSVQALYGFSDEEWHRLDSSTPPTVSKEEAAA